IPKATTGINHPVAFMHLQRRKDSFAMKRQSAHEDVPPSHELWHQDIVPEIHILASRLRRELGIAHWSTSLVDLRSCECLSFSPGQRRSMISHTCDHWQSCRTPFR